MKNAPKPENSAWEEGTPKANDATINTDPDYPKTQDHEHDPKATITTTKENKIVLRR